MEEDLKTAYVELEQQVKNSGMKLSRSNEILMQQVTLREKTEKVLKQINNTLAILSSCNDILNGDGDEKNMLNEICNTIVAIGNFPLVWVGAVERDGKWEVNPVAQCVTHVIDIKLATMTTTEFMDDQNPIGLALHSGRPGLARNLSKLDETKLWAGTACKCNYTSLISLPLKNKNEVFAVLSIYAADSSAFDDEQLGLFEQLADNVAFGLIAARSRNQGGRVTRKTPAWIAPSAS
jgi:GAF domain-containing protein